MSSDWRLRYIIVPELRILGRGVVLDVGCGMGRWGNEVRTHSCPSYLVGLDIWKPSLLNVQSKRIYDDLILADATMLPFREGSIDASLAFEVVEHLRRSKFEPFLASLEGISKETVMLSTPNWRFPQGEMEGNPYERHLSFWKDIEFKKRGYRVKGIGFQVRGMRLPSMVFLLGKYRRVFVSAIPSFGRFTNFAALVLAIKNLK